MGERFFATVDWNLKSLEQTRKINLVTSRTYKKKKNTSSTITRVHSYGEVVKMVSTLFHCHLPVTYVIGSQPI